MAAESDKIARAYARLVGLKESLPDWTNLPERYVEEYHEALQHLGDLGVDIAEFRVRSGDLERIVSSGNYLTGEVNYTKERYVPRAILLAKLTAVLTYFSIQDSVAGSQRQIGFKPRDTQRGGTAPEEELRENWCLARKQAPLRPIALLE